MTSQHISSRFRRTGLESGAIISQLACGGFMDRVRASTLFGVFVVAAATVVLCSGNSEAQTADSTSSSPSTAQPSGTSSQTQPSLRKSVQQNEQQSAQRPVSAPIPANARHMERKTRY